VVFSPNFQASVGIVTRIRPQLIPSTTVAIYFSLIILPFDDIRPEPPDPEDGGDMFLRNVG
jgi:hypothetical protein